MTRNPNPGFETSKVTTYKKKNLNKIQLINFIDIILRQSGSEMSDESNCIATLCDWVKISRHFINQSEVKPKTIIIRTVIKDGMTT